MRCTFAALLCVVTLCIGCGPGGPEIASVEGTVTMDGKPLENASVVFTPPNGRPAGARTDAEGHYVLNFSGGRQGAIPGENRVQISTLRDPFPDGKGGVVPAQPETVPIRYNQESELTFNVVDGQKNVADFELTSDGPINDEVLEN